MNLPPDDNPDYAHFWQLAMDGSSDGFWDWDVITGAVNYSKRWKELLGYMDEELRDTIETFNELVHPQDKDRVYFGMQHHFEQPQDLYTVEFRMRCKDGTYKWIYSRGLAERDPAGKVLRLAGSHSDITARKEHEEELERANEELRSALDQVQKMRHAMLRMCAWTKQVNVDGQWVSVEQFLADKLGVQITHGMSEEARQKMQLEFEQLSVNDQELKS
jgi:PAS domain S-box-containing protein